MLPSTSLPAGEGPAVPGADGPRRRRPLDWWLRRVAAVLVVLAVVLVGLDQLSSAPAVCGSCHEMAPRASAWAKSPHANVKCTSCHVAPHPWYAYPQTLYERFALLARDSVRHATIGSAVVDSRPAGVAAMSDLVCEQCHDPNRKPTAGLGILIDHPKHAKRNGSCVSCHITVAHPKPSRGTALSFMGQCFTCHGLASNAKASAKCSICHPKDFALKPQSHASAKWKRTHGQVAVSDPKQCEMCHQRTFCDSCHGLKMPHPTDWARRTGHPVAAKADRQVCDRCHGGQADWCTMCHHKGFDPAKGTWVKQHFTVVETKGASFCLERCHSPVYCANCHVSGIAREEKSSGPGI